MLNPSTIARFSPITASPRHRKDLPVKSMGVFAACSVVFFSGVCNAESWEKYDEAPGGVSIFIDADSVRRVPGYPEFFDFKVKYIGVLQEPYYMDLYYQVVADCDSMKAVHYREEGVDKRGDRRNRHSAFSSSESAASAVNQGTATAQWLTLPSEVCRGIWKLEKANKIPPIEKIAVEEDENPRTTSKRSQVGKSAKPLITVPLRKRGGVYEVMATLNSEIKVYFVVDSGAADVTINEKIAQLLVDNGSITNADLVGSRMYQVANGKTVTGAAIRIRSLNIGGHILKDVNTVVLKGEGVPVLLGQSALGRLGKWSINISIPQLEIAP